MEVSPLTANNPTTVPAANVAAESGANISADFETFLKMLTVQMQNQDPLNPIDSADYAVQLATFSGVEQQVQTNDLLRALSGSLGAASLTEMAAWVGMDARSSGPAYFNGSPVTVVPDVMPASDSAQLIVKDSLGNEVQRLSIGTDGQPVTWDGRRADGALFGAGEYSFETASYSLGALQGQSGAQVYRRVTEVQAEGGTSVLVLEGGGQVNATDVTALREPTS